MTYVGKFSHDNFLLSTTRPSNFPTLISSFIYGALIEDIEYCTFPYSPWSRSVASTFIILVPGRSLSRNVTISLYKNRNIASHYQPFEQWRSSIMCGPGCIRCWLNMKKQLTMILNRDKLCCCIRGCKHEFCPSNSLYVHGRIFPVDFELQIEQIYHNDGDVSLPKREKMRAYPVMIKGRQSPDYSTRLM